MYLKLALRNAKRSLFDYLLYIISMITLISIICISNCLACLGSMQFDFQTASLPLLIVAVMIFLVDYLNVFIVKQRAKEFATYMLLGMEKSKLSSVFLIEICVVGALCFIIGTTIGIIIYYVCFEVLLEQGIYDNSMQIISKGVLQTLMYFCIVEIVSIFRVKRWLYKLEISRLMNEKRHNEPLRTAGKSFWCRVFTINLLLFLVLLLAVTLGPDDMAYVALPVISIPMLCLIFSFYKWMYAFLASLRIAKSMEIYQDNRLYFISELTASSRTAENLNAIFSICLIFSVISFIFGSALLDANIQLFSKAEQNRMGFLQISISIVFLVIYFSVSSLHQIIGIRKQQKKFRLLGYIGKNQGEIKSIVKTQILMNLFIPIAMALFLIFISVPFVNHKLNIILPVAMHNFPVYAVAGFLLCFFLLYMLYFSIVLLMCSRYMKPK